MFASSAENSFLKIVSKYLNRSEHTPQFKDLAVLAALTKQLINTNEWAELDARFTVLIKIFNKLPVELALICLRTTAAYSFKMKEWGALRDCVKKELQRRQLPTHILMQDL